MTAYSSKSTHELAPNIVAMYAEVLTAENGNGLAVTQDLATDGPSVSFTLGANDLILVQLECEIINPPATGEADVRLVGDGATLDVMMLQNTNVTSYQKYFSTPGSQVGMRLASPTPWGGLISLPQLPAGARTLKMRYINTNSAQAYRNRKLRVIQVKF